MATELVRLEGHRGAVRDLAVKSDGSLLASAGADQTVRFWDTASWIELVVLEGHSKEVNALRFSTDDSLLVSGGSDGSIVLWDVLTRALLHSVTFKTDNTSIVLRVTSLAFSPDGTILAVGTNDGLVRFLTIAE